MFEFKFRTFRWRIKCGELHLLVSWCVGDRCDMACSDKDHGMSRRPGAEDRGWSSIGRILGGRVIRKSGDAVCGLHRTWGDEENEFLGCASKPGLSGFPICASKLTAPVWWFRPQNHRDVFLVCALKPSGIRFVRCATNPTKGGWHGTRAEIWWLASPESKSR
jgi:hypothetical protein